MTSSVLSHLAFRFAASPENLATEALTFILNQSEAARHVLIDLVRPLIPNCPPDLAFKSQSRDQEGCRPDLVGKAGSSTFLAVEAKFWAGLTDAQPLTYLDVLDDGGVLLFVAPGKRRATLWTELTRRVSSAGLQPIDRPQPLFDCAQIDSKFIAQISWRGLLSGILAALEDAGDALRAADARQLLALSEQMDDEAFFPLRGEELTSDTGRRLVQYCNLVDDVMTKLASAKLADLKGCRATGGRAWYARYHRFVSVGGSLLVSAPLWSTGRQTPVWLNLQYWWNDKAQPIDRIAAELSTNGIAHYLDDWGCNIPIFLETGVEREAVIEGMLDQLNQCANLVQKVIAQGKSVKGKARAR